MNRDHHPDWYYPIQGMRTLILGTFPPHKDKRHIEFYYPNKQNRFWSVFAEVAGKRLSKNADSDAVNERKQLMKLMSVGVQNLGKTIGRKGKSSLDRDISILEFQNIVEIIDTNDTLKVIHLTGYSGPSSTYHSFIRYLDDNGIAHTLPEKIEVGQTFTVERNRPIKCILGNSTSRAARRVSFEELVEQFKRAMVDEHR
ncbi:MAG: hypothetical protein JNJ49_06405 [Bdellovibrionaceae bacterium]|nr:hypothetical protein [Pseudobdellovibrionaceae bacterium]